MILVDDAVWTGAPWAGGYSCHLISDTSVDELLDFGEKLRLPEAWFQVSSTPHWDLSPSWRTRAVSAGAQAVGRSEFAAALKRFRETHETKV